MYPYIILAENFLRVILKSDQDILLALFSFLPLTTRLTILARGEKVVPQGSNALSAYGVERIEAA